MNPDLVALKALVDAELPRALFVTVSGSHLYGFSSVDSDIDLRGTFLAPFDQIIGLNRGPETVERDLLLDGIEVEFVAHEAAKYLQLLGKDNGYILEQVFSPLIVTGREFLERLRPIARRCATRACHHHYRGFYRSRREALEREPVKRAKSLLYAYRVLLTGIHLLSTGEVEANLPALNERFRLPYIDDLIARKHAAETGTLAELDWSFHASELDRLCGKLDQAHAASALPEKSPRDELHRFLIDLRLEDSRHG